MSSILNRPDSSDLGSGEICAVVQTSSPIVMRIPSTGWPALSTTLPVRQPVWARAASGEKISTRIAAITKTTDTTRLAILLDRVERAPCPVDFDFAFVFSSAGECPRRHRQNQSQKQREKVPAPHDRPNPRPLPLASRSLRNPQAWLYRL